MNYYGSNGSETIPMGYEFTNTGFVHYKSTAAETVDPIQIQATSGSSTSSTMYFDITTFKTAPVGLYSMYGLFDDTNYDTQLKDITEYETKQNQYFLGNRRTILSNTGTNDINIRNCSFTADSNYVFSLPANTPCKFVHRYLAGHRTAYILDTNNIQEYYAKTDANMSITGLQTSDISWDGKAKLVNILNIIDKGTNMWIWLVFTFMPMLCVIVMTILIGMSFLTETKLWLAFCERFFDPVKVLTLGGRDSTTWQWRTVLVPCLVTYTAFALFCNGNIIKIIIWVVDAWVRLMQYI